MVLCSVVWRRKFICYNKLKCIMKQIIIFINKHVMDMSGDYTMYITFSLLCSHDVTEMILEEQLHVPRKIVL